jgi:inner membrane protein
MAFLCIVCSVAPDLDSIGFQLGIPYHHWLGHRGFSHSILFALILALIASLFILNIEKSMRKRLMLFLAFFICAFTHDVLDAMTNGGLGVAFLSPLSEQRFFFPWRPIEVSPISPKRFFTSRGLAVLSNEFVYVILPLLLVAIIVIRKKIRRRTS